VASAIADEKKLERQMNEQLNQAEEWERKAVLALRAEKEDLAKEALVRKQDFEAMATQYKTQWEAQHASVEKLKVALRQLQQKIEEAQRKKNLLVARAKPPTPRRRLQQTMGSFSDTSAFEAFDRMAAKVEKSKRSGSHAGDRGSNDAGSSRRAGSRPRILGQDRGSIAGGSEKETPG
jgi:phage shock protein A